MNLTRTISFGASLLAASSIGSYGLGLLRDRLLASQFGASAELDVYSASFLIPDFIMSLFAAALTSAFVPVFLEWRHKHGKEQSWQLTNTVLYLVTFIIIIAAVLAFFLAPWLTKIITPGFDEARHLMLVSTTRLMLISPIIFSFSILFGATLQGLRRFIAYALSPILYNLGIVLGLTFLAPIYGIKGAIMGVLLGAFLHMIVRFGESLIAGWRFKYKPVKLLKPWKNPAIVKIVKLMIPRAIALLTWQANLWVYTAIASGLAVGSIAIFNLARNFQSLPVSLFGIAFATAAFPALSSYFSKKEKNKFRQDLAKTIRQILFFTIPAAAGLVVLAKPLVDFFLGSGKFTDTAVITTGAVLAIFALSVPLESLQHILARGFYARHDTITPVKITLLATLINVVVSYFSSRVIGVSGLALGFIFYSLTQVVLLSLILKKRIYHFNGREILKSTGKIMLASVVMGLIVYVIVMMMDYSKMSFIVGVLSGGAAYLILAVILRMPELSGLKIVIKKFL